MAASVMTAAPDFTAEAYDNGDFSTVTLSALRGKKVVLFFYPLDFTFVCPTEILAFADNLEEFKKRDTVVLGVSVDSKFTHSAWANTARVDGGIKGVNYPLLADLNKQIARDYGVLHDDAIAVRGLFIIDKTGVLQHVTINALGLGRSIDEVLRLLDAIDYSEQHGEVCPANWKKGDKAMKPTDAGLKEFMRGK